MEYSLQQHNILNLLKEAWKIGKDKKSINRIFKIILDSMMNNKILMV